MTKPRSDRAKPEATRREPPVAHHTILSLEVTGGFLKGAKFEFVDGLNCIIGGRGTGKTTVLKFVRYVLELMPDDKATPARARAIKALVQSNLGNGRIRLGVRTKHGMGYLSERPWNDSAQVRWRARRQEHEKRRFDDAKVRAMTRVATPENEALLIEQMKRELVTTVARPRAVDRRRSRRRAAG